MIGVYKLIIFQLEAHLVIIRPRKPSSGSFCQSSVGLSVSNERVLWKNGRFDRDVVWDGGSGGLKESCIRSLCTLAPRGKYG